MAKVAASTGHLDQAAASLAVSMAAAVAKAAASMALADAKAAVSTATAAKGEGVDR